MKGFHSDFVCRVAGLPIAAIESLRCPDALDHVLAMLGMERTMTSERARLSDDLFGIIGQMDATAARGPLLRLRRDLHNGRTPPPAILHDARDILPSPVVARVDHLLQLAAAHGKALADANTIIDDALARSRRTFQQSVHDEDFRRGVLLSSDTLFQNIARYCRAPAHQISGRDEQIERGLLRYFSRMATKGTPFGTFCTVIPGRIEETSIASTSDAALSGRMDKRSFVRLNKSLFVSLWTHLTSRDAVRNALYVDTNPTVSDDNGRMVFLTNMNGLEAFQRLGTNDVLTLVREIVAAAPCTFGELARKLSEETGDTSSSEVRPYLDRLIEIGFVRFLSGISQQDVDWDQRLVEILTPIADESARHVIGLLTQLRGCIEVFDSAPITERRALLQRMRAVVDESASHLGITQGLSHDLPCYEDSSAECTAQLVVGPEMNHAFDRLAELLQLTSKLSAVHNEQAIMRNFFERHYGPNRAEVPLLTFYEDFYRGYMKERLERERRPASQSKSPVADEAAPIRPEDETPGPAVAGYSNLPVVEARAQAVVRLRQWYTQRLADNAGAEEITIHHGELAEILSGIPSNGAEPYSLSLFGNILPPHRAGEAWRIFVPSARALMGFGKYFSRFLYMFPSAVRDGLENASAALSDDRIAEICDDGNFNGNLHPPLLSWELDYPTYAVEQTSSLRLQSTEMVVRRSTTSDQALQLLHIPSNTRVWPVDLGFLNPLRRPALFQLLSRFQPASAFMLALSEGGKVERDSPSTRPIPGVMYRPRISYEGSIVLARRRWLVAHTDMPQRVKAEADGEYFVRVNRWRCAHGIPERVFVRVNAQGRQAGGVEPAVVARAEDDAPTPPEQNQRPRRRDQHKPQFIDFASPMLIGLFARIAGDLSSFVLVVEECLPDLRDGWRHGTDDDVYAAECMIQFNVAAPGHALVSCAFAMGDVHE